MATSSLGRKGLFQLTVPSLSTPEGRKAGWAPEAGAEAEAIDGRCWLPALKTHIIQDHLGLGVALPTLRWALPTDLPIAHLGKAFSQLNLLFPGTF